MPAQLFYMIARLIPGSVLSCSLLVLVRGRTKPEQDIRRSQAFECGRVGRPEICWQMAVRCPAGEILVHSVCRSDFAAEPERDLNGLKLPPSLLLPILFRILDLHSRPDSLPFAVFFSAGRCCGSCCSYPAMAAIDEQVTSRPEWGTGTGFQGERTDSARGTPQTNQREAVP